MKEKLIEIREYKKMNLREGILFIGIPSEGFFDLILANYYIKKFNLDSIALIYSELFPPVTFIYKGKPKFPARIHADEKLKFAVVTAEFAPHVNLSRILGKAICEWADKNDIHHIITVNELIVDSNKENPEIFGIGSTDEARNLLKEKGIPSFEYGVLVGLPAVILDECRWLNISSYCILAEINPQQISLNIVGRVLEALNRLFPSIAIEVEPLIKEMEILENQIREIRNKTKPIETQPSMLFYG